MKPLYIIYIALVAILSVSNPAMLRAAEPDSTRQKLIHRVGIDLFPGYVFPTHDFFKGTNRQSEPVNTTMSAHLKWAFQFAPDSYFGRNYPYASQGIGVAYNTFFNGDEVGTPVALYVFQTSRIASLTERLSLDYEWNFGASFGWKPYDEFTNDYNNIVGSKVNAYINLGLMLNYRLTPDWSLTLGAGFTHFSNGNTSYPNAGVNTVGGRIGVVRTFGGGQWKPRCYAPDPFTRHISYDLVLYGAVRKRAYIPSDPSQGVLLPGHFGVLGLNFNPMYNVSRYFRAGLSLDAQYDESANLSGHVVNPGASADDLKFYRPPFREQFAVGLSVRAEIVMPIFAINIGVGRNIICKGKDTDHFYQILALKTHLTKDLFLHVGYQLYKFKDPNNLMLGIGYRFHSKR